MDRADRPRIRLTRIDGGKEGSTGHGRSESASCSQVSAPPKELSRAARAIWRRLAPQLARQGRLTPLDRDQFALYCDALAKLWIASLDLDVGLLVPGRRDPLRTTPVWKVYRELLATCRALGAEFGLTPGTRVRLASADAPMPERDVTQESGPGQRALTQGG